MATSLRPSRRSRRAGPVVLLVLAVAAMVLQGASLPHRHDGAGYHNQEHDLSYLATLGSVAPLAANAIALAFDTVGEPTLGFIQVARPVGARRAADSRAPPLA